MMAYRNYALLLVALVAGQILRAQDAPIEQSNVFIYGVNLTSDYDDRHGGAGAAGSGLVASVQPQLGLRLLRRRWESTIDYLSGFTYSTQTRSSYDPISQALGLSVTNRLSKRSTFSLQNNFTITSNPFDTIRARDALQPVDVLEQPNSTLPSESFSRVMEQAATTLSYALDSRSVVGVGGSFIYLDYRDAGAVSFPSSRRSVTQSANIFYNRATGRRSTMGFKYLFRRLDFGRGAVTTDSHNVVYQWSMALGRVGGLSVFAGPAYTDTRADLLSSLGVALRETGISAVGGATLSWKDGRSGASASALHQISDGGGSGGSVILDSFKVEVSRQLSKRSIIRGFVDYNRNHLLLAVVGSPSSFDYLSGGLELSRKISPHVSMGLSYLRIQEEHRRAGSSLSGNRIGIRLSYSGEKPLGR